MTEIQQYNNNDVAHIDSETTVLPAGTPSPDAMSMLMQHAQAMQTAHQLATALVSTSMVPAIYQGKADEAAAAILYGAELGLNPIQSLQQVFPVKGKPAIYARTMVALVKSHGYTLQTTETSDESVTVAASDPRTGIEEMSTWTIERARKAGYTGNSKYESDPQAMLYAKAATEVCRKIAPDVLLGIAYSREELELEQGEPLGPKNQPRRRGGRGLAGLRDAIAPAPVVDAPAAEPAPKPASKAQRNQLAAELVAKVSTEQTEVLAWLSAQLGRDELITSTADLTADEADQMINDLAAIDEPEPQA